MLVENAEEWKILHASKIIELGTQVQKKEQGLVQELQKL